MRTALPRIPALLLSAFLQLAPLLRIASTEATVFSSPVFAALRWIAGATAVAGSFHAVSGATGLTITPGTKGTNGVVFGARASIVSGQHGAAKSYSVMASSSVPGLVMSKQGVFSGIPTQTGTFATRITGWQNANTSGDNFTTTATFTIAAPASVAPTISVQPVSLTTTEGDPATFTVAASGTPAPTFQWTFAGKDIPGALGSRYQIVKTTLGDNGDYAVVVSNTGGTVTSSIATLTVKPAAQPPKITVQPTSSRVTATSNAVFSVVATGTTPLTYRWTRGSTLLPAATTDTLTLFGVTAEQAGSYQVTISNLAGTVTSNPAILMVDPLPVPVPVAIGAPEVSGSSFRFGFTTVAGFAYVVERNDSLDAAAWTTVTNLAPSGLAADRVVTDGLSGNQGLYRVRSLP